MSKQMDSPQIVTPPASNGAAIIELHGEHDLATGDAVAAALAAVDHGSAVVDLSACTFIDSTIIGILFEHANGRRMTIVAPPGTAPRRTLELVGPLFHVVDERPASAC